MASDEVQDVETRKWALEQAVRYSEISSLASDVVVRIADKFRDYAETGKVPR